MALVDDLYRTPSEIVNRFLGRAPVDLEAISRALELLVTYDRGLPDDVAGKLERPGGGRSRITVNGNHHRHRQRFTLAHEIGHYVLHRDLIGDGIVDDAQYRSSLGAELERQANRFAADVLMPVKLVRERFRAGERSVAGLAAVFDVSADVMRIRLQELRLG